MWWRVLLLDLPEHDTQAQVRIDRLISRVEELLNQGTLEKQREIELIAVCSLDTHD